MRVLLDESLPRRLKQELPEHNVTIVPEAGWAGTKSGDLLRLVEPGWGLRSVRDGAHARWDVLEFLRAGAYDSVPRRSARQPD